MMSTGSSRFRLAGLTIFALAAISALLISIWGLAGNRLSPAVSPKPDSDAASTARRYVLTRPFDPAGWLAWTGNVISRPGAASPLASSIVDATKTLGPVDPQVLRAQALLALRRGDIASGLERAAEIAMLFPAERSDAFTTLRAYLRDPAWEPFLASQLKRGWPQIDAFVLETCSSGAPLGELTGLVQQIVRKQPLSDETVTCIGNRAIAEGAVPAAYWVWLNASRVVPRMVGNVFNGDFELPSAGRLFDWRLAAGGEYREGYIASVRSDDSRGRPSSVLSIRFNGRPLRLPIAQQFLALAPGRYMLTYAIREVAMTTPGAASWAVRCVPPVQTPSTSAPTAEQRTGGWILRRQDITIPPGCVGQLLDLEVGNRLQMLQGLQGTVLFDDISIVRQ